MVDERLEEQAAERARIHVEEHEIARAIDNVAKAARVSPGVLVAEARRQGLTEKAYRDEIRRQLIDGKLTELYVRGRARKTDRDVQSAYERWTAEHVQLGVLALRLPPDPSPTLVARQTALAESIVTQARAGVSFCALVRRHTGAGDCGYRGAAPLDALLPPLAEQVSKLEVGAVTSPIRVADEAIVIIMRRPPAPLEEVQSEVLALASTEALARARAEWLRELRRRAFVEVRL